MDIGLKGRTLVDVAQELAVSGKIDLRGGTVEVHGRSFTVDRGTVTFPEAGDPANPTVVAAAYWDAPDQTRVWVKFSGPLKTTAPELSSEPAYSKTEILSVLLFGQPDPNAAQPGGSTGDAAAATAVGSGFVASGLNQALAQFDKDLDVETDTLSGNRTRGKIGHSFFDRRLKVQFAAATPGYAEQDTYFLLLTWQFVPKWSLMGTAGDQGTSIVDVLFQHRY
jgi:translocation and assembly module TamB